MVGLIATLLAFAATFLAGRRSLVWGLEALLIIGYFYGIVRANIPSMSAYFLFDAAVAGLFLTQIPRRLSLGERLRTMHLSNWVVLLVAWPVVLLLIPIQDPMVQLVGLRAHIFFLPFLLLGARLRSEDVHRLALCLAVLNLLAFGFGIAEFFLGIAPFYPHNDVTDLIYRSRDIKVTGDILGAFRIPAIFANSAAFGGTMVISIPIILGAWVRKPRSRGHRSLLTLALAGTLLGVFMAASRTHFMVLLVLLLISMFRSRLGVGAAITWIVLLLGLTWTVASHPRLQRFTSIDPTAIADRLAVSVNHSFVEIALKYPMGNGLGGGGSSLPYFLQRLIRDPIGIENQFGTILLEQGLPGLLLWIAFICWILSRRTTPAGDPWAVGRTLAWYSGAAYFASGLIGVGLLTSIPFTVILLLSMGWIAVPPAPDPESGTANDASTPRHQKLVYVGS